MLHQSMFHYCLHRTLQVTFVLLLVSLSIAQAVHQMYDDYDKSVGRACESARALEGVHAINYDAALFVDHEGAVTVTLTDGKPVTFPAYHIMSSYLQSQAWRDARTFARRYKETWQEFTFTHSKQPVCYAWGSNPFTYNGMFLGVTAHYGSFEREIRRMIY